MKLYAKGVGPVIELLVSGGSGGPSCYYGKSSKDEGPALRRALRVLRAWRQQSKTISLLGSDTFRTNQRP